VEELKLIASTGVVGVFAVIFYRLYLKEREARDKGRNEVTQILKDVLKMTKSFEDVAETVDALVKQKDSYIVEIAQNTRKLCKAQEVEKEVRQRMNTDPFIQIPQHLKDKDSG
jgi:hypothetical protein